MNKGFTLIELLITISVFGIILASSIYGFTSLRSSICLKSCAQQVASDLFYSKQKAISCSGIIEMACSADKYYIRKYDIFMNSFEDQKTIHLPAGINFTNDIIFRFASSGYPLPGYIGTATIDNAGGKLKKIIVSSAGRIRIE